MGSGRGLSGRTRAEPSRGASGSGRSSGCGGDGSGRRCADFPEVGETTATVRPGSISESDSGSAACTMRKRRLRRTGAAMCVGLVLGDSTAGVSIQIPGPAVAAAAAPTGRARSKEGAKRERERWRVLRTSTRLGARFVSQKPGHLNQLCRVPRAPASVDGAERKPPSNQSAIRDTASPASTPSHPQTFSASLTAELMIELCFVYR